ncbi:hypothetical protein L3X38_030076 [Prunus dulcis]|uniref:Uncharacterized protein n=1 Tax=Prunus dulcis TaxID=3755 RepID=A0AAD4YGF0_PRUDU|nr:hypothetical protein L3X38_030076 [Prunus dulcis]
MLTEVEKPASKDRTHGKPQEEQSSQTKYIEKAREQDKNSGGGFSSNFSRGHFTSGCGMSSHGPPAKAVMLLMSTAPQKAVLAETGEVVDVDEVKLNIIVAVEAGEVMPIDGIVVE